MPCRVLHSACAPVHLPAPRPAAVAEMTASGYLRAANGVFDAVMCWRVCQVVLGMPLVQEQQRTEPFCMAL